MFRYLRPSSHYIIHSLGLFIPSFLSFVLFSSYPILLNSKIAFPPTRSSIRLQFECGLVDGNLKGKNCFPSTSTATVMENINQPKPMGGRRYHIAKFNELFRFWCKLRIKVSFDLPWQSNFCHFSFLKRQFKKASGRRRLKCLWRRRNRWWTCQKRMLRAMFNILLRVRRESKLNENVFLNLHKNVKEGEIPFKLNFATKMNRQRRHTFSATSRKNHFWEIFGTRSFRIDNFIGHFHWDSNVCFNVSFQCFDSTCFPMFPKAFQCWMFAKHWKLSASLRN